MNLFDMFKWFVDVQNRINEKQEEISDLKDSLEKAYWILVYVIEGRTKDSE